jgi:predicted nucleic acid-binding protein
LTDCLDSWAILRWLEGEEPAASLVERSLETRPVMSWINLGEVFYVVHRAAGVDRARATIGELRHLLLLDLPTEGRVLEAAAIKATHALAYADAFAIATAMAHNASLLTGDPEILDGGDPTWPVVDLRPQMG